jgi:hypothetical protein
MIAFRKTLMVALTVGFVLSLTLWLAVKVNGDFAQSSASSYMGPLVRLQQSGLDSANRWFPCASDGSTGCESYKTAPAIVIVNGIVFSAILLVPIYLIRKWTTTLD